ncbi:MAG: hypothetical protein C4560_13765 [Nitrospiraceae bacterium]|nr:MAG: hypothetical protein C4560_13765 [Nitrospiraceae bacterium]
MSTVLGNFGANLFQNIEQIQKIWFEKFGNEFQDSWKDPHTAIKNVVSLARKTLAENKGFNIHNCHLTLLMRDPITDRLVLVYSTNEKLNPGNDRIPAIYFSEAGKESNFDNNTKKCYYKLHDRLSSSDSDRCGEMARKERGLTGWVAVTGTSLIINSSKHADYSARTFLEDARIDEQCQNFGEPFWGCRISEFPRKRDDNAWSLRYMAVPIKSIINPVKTIGVLRFVAPLSIPELTQIDLFFLEEVANVIAALNNIEGVKIIINRTEEFEKEKMIFEATGDFSRFLCFMSRSLRSYISSLYICLKKNDNIKILRLFDAYGITGKTGELRNTGKIQDYHSTSGGLTYRLLSEPDPKVYDAVVTAPGWAGLNTILFYRSALENLGVPVDESNLREIVSRYGIKLMGCGLKEDSNNNPIGVLKVEFPVTFDDSKHYDRDDKDFFIKCAKILTNEVVNYKRFIEDNLLERRVDPSDFIKYLLQIQRYKLLEPSQDFHRFWVAAAEYAVQHKTELEEATYDLTANYEITALNSAWDEIKKIQPKEPNAWLILFIDKVIDALFHILPYLYKISQ